MIFIVTILPGGDCTFFGSSKFFSGPGQFDRYCKLVLEHEAIDYLRKMSSLRDRYISLNTLPQKEMDRLSAVDRYPSDSYIFSSHGCDLLIENELVADAFAGLTEQEQSILILHCILHLSDAKIGQIVGLCRNTVQRHRNKALEKLRIALCCAAVILRAFFVKVQRRAGGRGTRKG